MKLVLTNDDGIDEPGLGALAALCAELGEVVVVAPSKPQSGVGHTFTEHRPIHVHERDAGRFAVDGTPADCARLALTQLAPDADWLLSGINAGANLGMDVHVSGTVAAAREAAIFGVPALAISQYLARFREADWTRTRLRAEPVVRDLLATELPPRTFWNVNLPHPRDEAVDCEREHCELDPSRAAVRYVQRAGHFHWEGDYHNRPRLPGRDIDVCFGGRIAITSIAL